jgi:hypothetical protein
MRPVSEFFVYCVRFHVLTVASTKCRDVWDVAPCSRVEVDQRLRRAYCRHHYRHDDLINLSDFFFLIKLNGMSLVAHVRCLQVDLSLTLECDCTSCAANSG